MSKDLPPSRTSFNLGTDATSNEKSLSESSDAGEVCSFPSHGLTADAKDPGMTCFQAATSLLPTPQGRKSLSPLDTTTCATGRLLCWGLIPDEETEAQGALP